MSLNPHLKTNFETMRRACKNGDLVLLDCKDAKTGETVAAVCMAQRGKEGDIELIPVARMIDGDPFEQLLPPAFGTPDGYAPPLLALVT